MRQTKIMKTTCPLLIFFWAVYFIKNTDGARILAIFPIPAPSHFPMYRETLKHLARNGHRVEVISPFPLKKPQANYTTIVNLESKLEAVDNSLSFEFLEKKGSGHLNEYGAEVFGNELCELLGDPDFQSLMKNPPNDPPYDILITELFFANCFFAFGRHLKIPVVAMTSTSMMQYTNEALGNPLNTGIVPEYEGGSILHMNFWQRLRNTICTAYTIHRIRNIIDVQSEIVKRYFGPEMPEIRELERDISLLLVNSHYTMNGIRPMTPAVVEVGGLHIEDVQTALPEDFKKWLDNSRHGFIYISFGTLLKIESLPKHILHELYVAFDRIAPLRILMKASSPEELPPGLPKNVMTLTWIPQVQVLKHKNIRGFVTHGGLGGVQEAIHFAVPFVGIPMFAEQPLNVKNCVDRGVAVSLGNYKDITADNFVEAVKAIVYDPKYKSNMIALSKQFLDRPRTPRDTAAFWIEYIIKHGGDSLRSPAVKLTWWQLALLDVYGSLIVSILVVIYFVRLLLLALIRRVFRRRDTVITISKKKK